MGVTAGIFEFADLNSASQEGPLLARLKIRMAEELHMHRFCVLIYICFMLPITSATWAGTVKFRHIADVRAPVAAAVKFIACEPSNCVYLPDRFGLGKPYGIVGAFVDTGVRLNINENDPAVIMLSSYNVGTMIPLNSPALADHDVASAGDIPRSPALEVNKFVIEERTFRMHSVRGSGGNADDINWPIDFGWWTALALRIGDRNVAIGISENSTLLVALDSFVRHTWESSYYAWEGGDCQQMKDQDSHVICPGDVWPTPSGDIPIADSYSNRPIEFSLWEMVTVTEEEVQ